MFRLPSALRSVLGDVPPSFTPARLFQTRSSTRAAAFFPRPRINGQKAFYRPTQRCLRSQYSTVVVHNRPQHRGRRIANFLAISSVSFLIGGYLSLEYGSPFLAPLFMGSMPTDEETLFLYEAPNEVSRKIDEHIKNCAIAQKYRANPGFIESRPHLKIPEAVRGHNLTGSTLAGPGMIVVPPYVWGQKEGKELVEILYVGNNVSGHAGMVHGGLLATLLDEGLARCCFPALPNQVGVTARLEVNYKKPTGVDQYLVLRAKTVKIDGRKATVQGHIETMPENGDEPEILASAEALYVEPKHAQILKKLYRIT